MAPSNGVDRGQGNSPAEGKCLFAGGGTQLQSGINLPTEGIALLPLGWCGERKRERWRRAWLRLLGVCPADGSKLLFSLLLSLPKSSGFLSVAPLFFMV